MFIIVVPMLVIPESEIRRHGPGDALRVCWRQWRAERALARRGLHFRSTAAEAIAAYAAMTAAEFEAVNGRQDWANWRTIPRCLSGNVCDRPLRILDLGCGNGSSTRVLAWYAPAGSHVTGYELAEPLLALARRRHYLRRDGQEANVDFVCQNLAADFFGARPDGSALAPGSVDAINASGVVGHHLTAQTIQPLIGQLQRALRPGGIAMLDVGPTLPERALTQLLKAAGFRKRAHCRSWRCDPTGQVVYAATGSSGSNDTARGQLSQA